MMKKNLNMCGRVLRGVVGVALLVYAAWTHSWWMGFLGLFVCFEAVAGWCAVRQLFGKDSCSRK